MAYDDLREFISALEKAGELKRITVEVDPVLEITEIADRMIKRGGPALLFENVKGSKMPMLINAFGSDRRMELVLSGEAPDQVAERISGLLHMAPPDGLLDKIKMLPRLFELGAFLPKKVGKGAAQEVVRERDFSLRELPVLQCWPDDAGRFITFPLVFSRDPKSGKRNCGMYRMQVYDDRITGMHWQTHKQGAEHFRRASRTQDAGRMEVAVAIGTDPCVTFSAIAPLPPDIDEMMFAGFLRGKPVEMVACKTVDLEVPATAEIVLEGYVDLSESRREGPFGDHTGFYSLADDYPVFHVTTMTHRRNPIYSTTIVGKPPMEDCWMGRAVERIFLPLLKMQLPEVVDMALPWEGVFHNLMIIAIRKSYPGQARKVMSAIWGTGQAMFTKCIVVVDDDVNVHSPGEVVWKALNNIDPERDVQFTLGPVDSLDHASRLPNFGSKMGIDATRKWPQEGFEREWPEEIRMDPRVKAIVDAKWDKLGL